MLEEGTFPDDWEIVDQSVSSVFSKILERLIFTSSFNYFMQNKLFTECQSGFVTGYLCVFHLLFITNEIFKSFWIFEIFNFDYNHLVHTRGSFLDISKTFGKVWHKDLIFKLQFYGIKDNLLFLLRKYPANRKQRVVLNGQISSWNNISAGSVLGHLLFLIKKY